MNEFKQALERGQKVRATQDEIITMFVKHIQRIDDMDTLNAIQKQLEGTEDLLKVVMYVHEQTEKIVSKECQGCGEIKLTEDFAARKGKEFYMALCKDCQTTKEGNK